VWFQVDFARRAEFTFCRFPIHIPMKIWKEFPRAFLLLLLLTGMLAGFSAPTTWGKSVSAAPMRQAATSVVISELRTRGTNGPMDEFIEIYNPTSTEIVIGGWQVRVITGTGTEASRVTITSGETLLPGQYYLIANNTATTGYSESVTPDQTYTTGIVDAGGVALFDTSGIKIDSVGLNTTYTFYTENSPLSDLSTYTPDASRSYERKPGGLLDSCQDSGNNLNDFQLLIPSSPQNSSTPRRLCGVIVPTPTPSPTPTDTLTPTTTSTPTLTPTQTPTFTPTPTPFSSLIITNTVNNSSPRVGANVVFTIKVTNPSTTLDATGVSVSAPLLAGLQYVSYSSTSGAYNGTSGVWSIGNLSASTSVTLIVTAKVVNSTPLPYSATVSSNEFVDSTATAPALNPLSGEAKLTLTHLPLTISTSTPGRVSLNLQLHNSGPDKATNIQVRDLLPSGLDYVSYTRSIGTYESVSGLWSISELPSGSNATLSITVDVAASGTSTRNFAEVWQSDQYDPDSTPGNGEQGEDDETFFEVPIADLSITETVDAAGGTAVFTITVRNSGPDDATGVNVSTALAGYTYVSDDGSGAFTHDVPNSKWVWNVASLAKNTSKTLTVTTTYAGAPVVNWAEVSAVDQVDPDSVPNNNSRAEDDDAGAPSADLSITKSVNNSNPDVGTNIIFTIVVSNAGPLATSNVKVKDFLPFGLTYVSDDGGGAYVSGTGIWTVAGSLDPNTSRTLKITARVASSGVKTNWAEVWASDQSDPDSTPGNGSQMEDDDASVVITPSSKPTATPTRTVTRTPTRTPTRTVTRTPTRTRTPTVTGTPPTRTPTRTRTPTPAPYKLVGRPIINEFLARPGYDWNQDGKVDVFDEFIEIKNIGNADVDVSGWRLDDEANQGSSPFTLPSLNLKPGQRAVFYGLQTNILLSDGGDTVRLLNPSNKVYDAYTYKIAKVEDQSVCRLPDGNGSWYEDCTPTPNLLNLRGGEIPSMPGESFESPVCDLPDTLPADFLFAECRGYGADIWHSFYWDQFGWQGRQSILENKSKWESFVE
jgi:uncharacterized repeat protein (TIGR01451 family)